MRYAVLDWTRIVGIAAIVTAHGLQAVGSPSYNLGGWGVTLMLILSGLLLRLSNKQDGFLVARLQRIYPTYWLCLVASVLIGLLGVSAWPTDLLDAALMVTGFCAFAGRWGCHLHTSWFIGLIVSLYVLYPVIARAMQAKPHATMTGLLLLSTASTLFVTDFLPVHARQWFPLARVFEFGLGVYLAGLHVLPLNLLGGSTKTLAWISDLTFPVFLIHYQLVAVFWHFSAPWNTVVYLVATLMVSAPILSLDRVMPSVTSCLQRKRITALRPQPHL